MNISTLLKTYPQRFQFYGNDLYMIFLDKLNYVLYNEVDNTFQYFIENDNLKTHVKDQNEKEFGSDVTRFVSWIVNEFDFNDCESNVCGFEESDEESGEESSEDETRTNRKYLYEMLRERVNRDRQLVIYSWGRKHRKRVPQKIDCNFNASILSGRRKGLNLKKYNGLSLEIQHAVETSKNYDTFFSQMIEKIERIDAKAIGINCTAGRHRSVTCAEVLKRELYPNSKIVHIELKKIN